MTGWWIEGIPKNMFVNQPSIPNMEEIKHAHKHQPNESNLESHLQIAETGESRTAQTATLPELGKLTMYNDGFVAVVQRRAQKRGRNWPRIAGLPKPLIFTLQNNMGYN